MAKIGRFLSPTESILSQPAQDLTIKPWQSEIFQRLLLSFPALPSDDHQIMNFILIVIEWFLVFDLLIIISLSWWKSQHSTAASPNAREKTRRELNSRNNWNFLWEWYSKLLLSLMLLMNAVAVVVKCRGFLDWKSWWVQWFKEC